MAAASQSICSNDIYAAKRFAKRKAVYQTTVLENPFIPHVPFPKQAELLESDVQEILYGGSAGGGKSDALLMAALQYVEVPGYKALIIRRTFPDLSLPNAIMDRALNWLAPFIQAGLVRWESKLHRFTFPSGATLTFAYLQHEADKYNFQSAEFDFIGIDELTQHPFSIYAYMWSRLRKLKNSKVPARFWCASNPGGRGHEWVKAYFVKAKRSDRLYIPSRLTENPYIDQEDYLDHLKRLPIVEQLQLIYGDWDVVSEGNLFKRAWFEKNIIDLAEVPHDARIVRGWDKAATAVSEENPDPDWTRGVKMAESGGIYYILDLVGIQGTPGDVDALMGKTALEDTQDVEIFEEQEPGSSGKSEVYSHSITIFKGFCHLGIPSSGDKVTRAKPMSSAAQQGRIKIVRGAWNTEWINEVVAFPQEGIHDDIVDATTLCFNQLSFAAEAAVDYSQLDVENAFGGSM